ncbi:hypothetical protein EJ07DRAFT_152209 [Lizonia empirigonia]|nr:hypothetical protein EJ07DRAFT_152209 [Lizonia empirigonia]
MSYRLAIKDQSRISSSPHLLQSLHCLCQQQTCSVFVHSLGAQKPPTLHVLSKSQTSTLPMAPSNSIVTPSEQAVMTPHHEVSIVARLAVTDMNNVATLGRHKVICSTNNDKNNTPASEFEGDDLEYDTEEFEEDYDEATACSVGLDAVIDGDSEAHDGDNDGNVDMHDREADTEVESEDEEEDSFALERLLTSSITTLGAVDDTVRTSAGSENVHKDHNVDDFAEKHITFTSRNLPTRQS